MKVKRIVHAVTVAALCAVAARAGERPVVCAQGPWEMSQATSPDVWMAAKVPGTVLGTLVANGKVPDPYYGLNNSISEGRIPDLSADRRFYEATFRTRVALPADFADKVVWMRPEGINYRSEIYLNGRLAATTAGMFARNAVDVTSFVRPGEANDLLVKVWPVDHPGSIKPKKWGAAGEWHNGGDGEIGRNVTMLMSAGWDFTFNDGIRDRNTGIWKPITFFATDSVRLDAPYVRTKLNADFSAADLTLEVDLHNPGNGWGSEVKGTIVAEVEGTDVRFEKQVKLFRGERRTEFLSAKMGNPELWWPRNKGAQKLYEARIRFIEEGKREPADAVHVRFGIRELTSGPRASDGARQFFVNRRPIFIRGTNWIPEAMLKTDDGRMEAEMRLTAQSGVNLVRLWAGGIVESDRFYELCDEYGLLVWQEFWMTGDTRHPDDPGLYLDNVRQQVKRIRSHACLAHWVASNESTEVEGTEELVKKLTGTTSWMMQSECDGVHDGSPYYPVNPMSYYEDTASDRGSRVYGFSPEYGTCALPPAECCRAFMPENLLWPIESNVAAWKYREGGGFDQLTEFHHAHVNGYGHSATFDDYARKSQAADALAHRALWETWNRARNHATGVLFWYNNTPIPQLGGHAWDYSLVSTASQFAQANALEPLHAQYEYLSNRVSIVSDVVGAHGLSVRAEVYDFDSRKVWERTAVAEVPGETCVDLFAIPFDSELRFDKPHFIKLRLFEKDEEIASTFYWRSTSRYEGPQTVTGPCVVGFEALEDLPRTRLTAREVSRARGRLTLEVGNAGDRVAFMTEVRVEGTDGKYLKPAFFSDNFFALLPGERKTVVVDHPDVAFRWRVKAWNATVRQGRTDEVLRGGWTADGESVEIPHCWNLTDACDGKDVPKEWKGCSSVACPSYVRKRVVYRRALPDPTPGRRQFVRFEGASATAAVCVNGQPLGTHRGAFTAFAFELTDVLRPTDNEIEVAVDNFIDPDVPPYGGDFVIYGGLYRDVHFVETDRVCIDSLTDGADNIVLEPDPETGNVVARVKVLGGTNEVQFFHFDSPKLWSPESPNLYSLTVEVAQAGCSDAVTIPFAFRKMGFRPDGFYLNGRKRTMRGVCRHQERYGKGWALSPQDHWDDFRIIKEMGADAVRFCHYPHSALEYSICDRLGLLVWAEMPNVDGLTFSDAFRANLRTAAREFVAQQRNHPSIFAWSVYNEIGNDFEGGDRVRTEAFLGDFSRYVKSLDPSRPTVAATCVFQHDLPGAWQAPWPGINSCTDLLAWNLYPGWYGEDAEKMGEMLDQRRIDTPERTVIGVSEYGAGGSVFQHGDPFVRTDPGSKWHPEEYQARCHWANYSKIASRTDLWCSFVWVMFDFASDARHEGFYDGFNDKGLVERDHRTRKDAFYFYQANWADRPVLHLVGGRMTRAPAATVNVIGFSNIGAVTLSVNGQTVSTQMPDAVKTVVFRNVRLSPGENVVCLSSGGLSAEANWNLAAIGKGD